MSDVVIASYIQTIVTLLVGSLAIFLYDRRKKDYKRDAANSILLEIQSAEATVSKVRDAVRNNNLDVDVSILQSESWSKNKYLFVRDFDKDEWEAISDFYNKSALLDEAISYNRTAFANDVEQIRANKQRVLASLAEKLVDNFQDGDNPEEARKLFELKAKTFDIAYMEKQEDFMYKPLKPLNDAKLYLQDFPKLTTSIPGEKLKKLAGSKS